MNNKVAIIGNDHINTLGVIRSFGENNIKPYIFLISNKKNNAVIKSKYVEKYWIFQNEEEALSKIINYFNDEKNKVALIPTSDASSLCLDNNYFKLKDKFYIPNINDKENYIYKFMDKNQQQKLFLKNDIKGIKSQVINFDTFNGDFQVQFPIILKPIISAKGNKEDIKICNNEEEFNYAREYLISLGYNEILVQKFIKCDYECDIQGFSINGKTAIPGVIEKIRIYPPQKGSTTYGRVVSIEKYSQIISGIKKIMKELKYTGIFDIDVFIANKIAYINEINFRNSAISYAYGNSYIAYYWYLSCISNKLIKPQDIKKEYTFIDEQADIHNVIDKIISIKDYQKSKKNAKILLVKNQKDRKPARVMFINKVIGNIFK